MICIFEKKTFEIIPNANVCVGSNCGFVKCICLSNQMKLLFVHLSFIISYLTTKLLNESHPNELHIWMKNCINFIIFRNWKKIYFRFISWQQSAHNQIQSNIICVCINFCFLIRWNAFKIYWRSKATFFMRGFGIFDVANRESKKKLMDIDCNGRAQN